MPINPAKDTLSESTLACVLKFSEAFNRHDVDAIMSLMTDDCVFENTCPTPDGERFEGQAAVRLLWERFFEGSTTALFETEDLFATGDRAVAQWRYRWIDKDGKEGHIRGIDLFRVRDGKVSEKLSYVKG